MNDIKLKVLIEHPLLTNHECEAIALAIHVAAQKAA